MKTELSAFDIHYVVKELDVLVGAKVDKIYLPHKGELLIRFHKTGIGKLMLRILTSKCLYLTEIAFKNPSTPHGFCLYLRKQLGNTFVQHVKQRGFERIVEIEFQQRDKKIVRFIAELFSKGNLVLIDDKGIIMSAQETQVWKDRTVRKGETYAHPTKEYNLLTITRDQLRDCLGNSTCDQLVKALAIDLGLGGVYAEELCLRTKVKKNMRPRDATDKDIEYLFETLEAMRSAEIESQIVSKLGGVHAVTPFPLEQYADFDAELVSSFNHAIDKALTTELTVQAEEQSQKKSNKALTKTQKIVDSQTIQVEQLQKAIDENQRKGELLYENYILLKGIIDMIKDLRKEKSWKEIKEMYKKSDVIKSIDEKTGKIVIEMGVET
jgi:predicted ribosome quality control (RQC) complex YloA/Tae2 family protein